MIIQLWLAQSFIFSGVNQFSSVNKIDFKMVNESDRIKRLLGELKKHEDKATQEIRNLTGID